MTGADEEDEGACVASVFTAVSTTGAAVGAGSVVDRGTDDVDEEVEVEVEEEVGAAVAARSGAGAGGDGATGEEDG